MWSLVLLFSVRPELQIFLIKTALYNQKHIQIVKNGFTQFFFQLFTIPICSLNENQRG
jgi:hypothetical protein